MNASSSPSPLVLGLWAIRPRTLPLAASAIVLGCGLAALDQNFSPMVGLLALVTALLLQILSNLANDYGDAVKGADTSARTGPLRVVGSGLVTTRQMKKAVVACALLAFGCGTGLVLSSFWGDPAKLAVFMGLGLCCVLGALGYTMGTRPYGYRGWGDLMAGLFFGPVAVLGTVSLNGGALHPVFWLPALAAGLCSTQVLNINNMRDVPTDRLAGKRTVAVRLGLPLAARYHALLALGTLGCWAGFWLLVAPPFSPALVLCLPLVRSAWLACTRNHDSAVLNAQLRGTVLGSALLNGGMGLLCFVAQ